MLEWNVYKEAPNCKNLMTYNIFDNYSFLLGLAKELKLLEKEEKRVRAELGTLTKRKAYNLEKRLYAVFDKGVQNQCMRDFLARSECEVVITSWPPRVYDIEIDRLVEEDKRLNEKWGESAYSYPVNLAVCKKVDIYEQLKLNWKPFLSYIQLNKKEIYKAARELKRRLNNEWTN